MELLAPAGNFEKLKSAVHFGCDAVYFAGKNFGLRAFAGNFSDDEIFEALDYLHKYSKKGYVTLNIVAKDSDFEKLDEYLSLLERAKVDGVIVSDVGLIDYICKNYPSINVHVSTQANVNNSFSTKFFADLGVKRIVLARELKLEEVKNIHKNNPNIELECVFPIRADASCQTILQAGTAIAVSACRLAAGNTIFARKIGKTNCQSKRTKGGHIF